MSLSLAKQRPLRPLPTWILWFFNSCCDEPVGILYQDGISRDVLYQDLISRNVLNP